MFEYSNLVVYLVFAGIVSAVIFILSYILVFQLSDAEKVSAYECGFAPYGDARGKFEVRFYLVAILFIVFDLEIAYLFPWTVSLSFVGMSGYIGMFIFLFILTVGFCYEWVKGALDWHKQV